VVVVLAPLTRAKIVTEGDDTMYHCESDTPIYRYISPLNLRATSPDHVLQLDENDYDEMSIPDETEPHYYHPSEFTMDKSTEKSSNF